MLQLFRPSRWQQSSAKGYYVGRIGILNADGGPSAESAIGGGAVVTDMGTLEGLLSVCRHTGTDKAKSVI